MGGGEMVFRAIWGALLLSILPIAGCGTVANVVRSNPETGGRTPFGGVRRDSVCITKAATGEFGPTTQQQSESEHYPQLGLMLICAADLPFSLIGDIVTWPYTASYTYINQPTPYPPIRYTNPPPSLPMPRPLPILPAPLPVPQSPQPVPIPTPATTAPTTPIPPPSMGLPPTPLPAPPTTAPTTPPTTPPATQPPAGSPPKSSP
jgi:uncharacterized protein YceK